MVKSFTIIASLILAFAIVSQSEAQCINGSCGTPFYGSPLYVTPPQQIYQPRVQWEPLNYQGTSVYQKEYSTPLRDLLFGKQIIQHNYSPQPIAPSAAPSAAPSSGQLQSQSFQYEQYFLPRPTVPRLAPSIRVN